jgi:hypothetical protein
MVHVVYQTKCMNVINVHEAKTNFSKLLERAANGERIIIGKAGKPVARLEQYIANLRAAVYTYRNRLAGH